MYILRQTLCKSSYKYHLIGIVRNDRSSFLYHYDNCDYNLQSDSFTGPAEHWAGGSRPISWSSCKWWNFAFVHYYRKIAWLPCHSLANTNKHIHIYIFHDTALLDNKIEVRFSWTWFHHSDNLVPELKSSNILWGLVLYRNSIFWLLIKVT